MSTKGSAATPQRTMRVSATLDRASFLRPIAHRGLHLRIGERIENTTPAFLAALERGYGIECDLQAASDGTPMVFHDERLDRLVAAPGTLAAYTPAQLARLRYRRHASPILRLAELLELVGARAPMLVEVKVNGRGSANGFLDKIARQARAYKGPIALMSFDRDVVAEIGRLAPTVPRGLVVGTHQLPPTWWAAPSAVNKGRILNRRLGGAPEGIAFFAIDVRMLRSARAWLDRHAPSLMLFSWTIRTARERAAAARWADAPIFEGYEA